MCVYGYKSGFVKSRPSCFLRFLNGLLIRLQIFSAPFHYPSPREIEKDVFRLAGRFHTQKKKFEVCHLQPSQRELADKTPQRPIQLVSSWNLTGNFSSSNLKMSAFCVDFQLESNWIEIFVPIPFKVDRVAFLIFSN